MAIEHGVKVGCWVVDKTQFVFMYIRHTIKVQQCTGRWWYCNPMMICTMLRLPLPIINYKGLMITWKLSQSDVFVQVWHLLIFLFYREKERTGRKTAPSFAIYIFLSTPLIRLHWWYIKCLVQSLM